LGLPRALCYSIFLGGISEALNRRERKENPQRSQRKSVVVALLSDLRGPSLRPLRLKAFGGQIGAGF
jgi:hypothetical protein